MIPFKFKSQYAFYYIIIFKQEIAEIIKEVDITNDGKINFLEFCTMIKIRDQTVLDDELGQIFDEFQGKGVNNDGINDGMMSKTDLCLAFKCLNEDIDECEIDQLFEKVGLQNQTCMNKEQFCDLFKAGQGIEPMSTKE